MSCILMVLPVLGVTTVCTEACPMGARSEQSLALSVWGDCCQSQSDCSCCSEGRAITAEIGQSNCCELASQSREPAHGSSSLENRVHEQEAAAVACALTSDLPRDGFVEKSAALNPDLAYSCVPAYILNRSLLI